MNAWVPERSVDLALPVVRLWTGAVNGTVPVFGRPQHAGIGTLLQVARGVGDHLVDQPGHGGGVVGEHGAAVGRERLARGAWRGAPSTSRPGPLLRAVFFWSRMEAAACSSQAKRGPSLEPKGWMTAPGDGGVGDSRRGRPVVGGRRVGMRFWTHVHVLDGRSVNCPGPEAYPDPAMLDR